ncbi:MAG: Ketopantoate reductase ApbA/PanE domain protein [Aeromicrobium sp.]|nr:Ketopantoate reductase ApbA/PanE domain protein [Aeromicrobium sp.]
MTRYVIIGAGAAGGTLAAQTHAAGIDHVLVARGESLRAIRERGLTFSRPSGTRQVPVDVVAGPDEVELTADDVLVLTTKAQHAEAALQQWAWQPVDGGRSTAAESLPVLTLQNGLDTERAALRRFDLVYGVSIWLPGHHVRPGDVANGGPDRIGTAWIGRYPHGGADDARLDRLVADLGRLEIVTQVVDDIVRWKAAKLIGNLTNALDVLSGASGPALEDAKALLEAEAREALSAAGIRPADYTTEISVDRGQPPLPVGDYTPGNKSTWQSLARGAGSIETDFLNGEIVLLGRLHGVKTPVNARLQALVSSSAATPDAIGRHGLDDLLR